MVKREKGLDLKFENISYFSIQCTSFLVFCIFTKYLFNPITIVPTKGLLNTCYCVNVTCTPKFAFCVFVFVYIMVRYRALRNLAVGYWKSLHFGGKTKGILASKKM